MLKSFLITPKENQVDKERKFLPTLRQGSASEYLSAFFCLE